MSELLEQAYAEERVRLSRLATEGLPDRCRLRLPSGQIFENVPCQLRGVSGNVDGAPYQIRFAWGSPAVMEAAVVVNAIEGREPLTLQLVEPMDSSTALWQEWRATSGPAFGRVNVGL